MNIAMYLRVSDSDLDLSETKYESDSIDSQRIMILNYISKNPELIGEVREYADDGYTGVNFNRPGFQSMINDAKKGLIDTIITKDLSRLGREYIGMGDFLEQIFPLLGVRVIAINSHYDSNEHEGDVAGIDSAITNLINSMYSRDLSQKRKTTNRIRWANGTVKSTVVPYGYEKDSETKEWIIDEYSGAIVERIFEWKAEGLSVAEISNKLNEQKILPPGLYNKKKHDYKYTFSVSPKENIWVRYKVRAILNREEYMGFLIVHKKETDDFEIGKEHNVPKSEWIYIPNHHPPIITKELYDAAHANMKKGYKHITHKNIDYLLKTKLCCGNCRLNLAYMKCVGEDKCYCRHRKEIGPYASCNDKLFKYRIVEENVYKCLTENLKKLSELDKGINRVIQKEMPEKKDILNNLEIQLGILKDRKLRQYEEYSEGKMSTQLYKAENEKITQEITSINDQIAQIKKQISEDNTLSMEVKLRSKLANEVIADKSEFGKLTKELVDMFIKMVYVHDEDRLEIEYTFDDIMDKAMDRFNDIR
ncbi:MAG: recombinase family protein [Eubacterium sp.]|nr:recombinase family protein [Eubacterium sp.]